MNPEIEPLIEAARKARDNARAPYSNFAVGAALQTQDGHIFSGCNVESSSFGLSVCAERVALFKALSEGYDRFVRLVVVTGTKPPGSPCGACRQLLWDYARGIEIILVGKTGEPEVSTIEELFARPFGEEDL
jgi:cytidine deaminase